VVWPPILYFWLALDPCNFLAWAHVSAEGAPLKYAKGAKDANIESAQDAKFLTFLFDYNLPIF
jgi:hypothetical protein